MLVCTTYIQAVNKESTILDNFAVPAVSGVPNAVKPADRLTCMVMHDATYVMISNPCDIVVMLRVIV